MAVERSKLVELPDVLGSLVVQCGSCEADITRYGYVPPELAEDLEAAERRLRVTATRDVVARGLILCPSCATRHRSGGGGGDGNNPCRSCGWMPEQHFGQLQLCVHQRVDEDGRVVRAAP